MFDQEADETFVGAERGAVDAERHLFGVVAGLVGETETFWLGEIDLIGGDGEFAADRAPDLDVDLRTVEGGFVWNFDVIDAAALENASDHVFGLEPECRVHRRTSAPSLAGSCVEKRMTYFSMPKSLKYLRYISFTARNSASNCSSVQ